MEADAAVYMQDMEEEEVEDEVLEEDHYYLKNTPNTETEHKVQQHWKLRKIVPSPTQKNNKIVKTKYLAWWKTFRQA